MASSEPIHQPLDDSLPYIRLFHLDPGQLSALITGELILDNLDGDPIYEALSYVWGESPACRMIIVNDKAFEVTENLHRALSQLRWVSRPRVLWIDQICIDQLDNAEKAAQVALMGGIFSKSREALLWVGDCDEFVKQPLGHPQIHFGQTTKQWVLSETGLPTDFSGSVAPRRMWTIATAIEAIDSLVKPKIIEGAELFSLLEVIASQPWWTRIWILQECVLPYKAALLYGPFKIPWDAFLLTVSLVKRSGHLATGSSLDLLASRSKFIQDMRERKHAIMTKQIDSTLLITYLWQACERAASNPVDKVYGVLGLIDRWIGSPLRIDYSVTGLDADRYLTLNLIRSTGTLDVLYHSPQELRSASAIDNKRESWVRSWWANWQPNTALGSLRYFELLKYPGLFRYRADVLEEPSRHGHSIGLLGFQWSTVRYVSEVFSGDSNAQRDEVLRSWVEGNGIKTKANAFQIESTLISTMVYSYLSYASTSGLLPQDSERHHNFLIWMLERCPRLFKKLKVRVYVRGDVTKAREAIRDHTVDMNVTEGIDQSINACTQNRRLFRTASVAGISGSYPTTRLGVGPRHLREGDLVTFLHGGRTPWILRPLEGPQKPQDPKRYYTLVGDAYVFGLMGVRAAPQWLDDYLRKCEQQPPTRYYLV